MQLHFTVDACTESYEAMRPVPGGRHCERCVRRIMDFTHIPDRDLVQVIRRSKGKVCGMFDAAQLDRLNRSEQVGRALPAWQKAAAAIAALTFVAGSLPAQQPADGTVHAKEERCEVGPRTTHVHENGGGEVRKSDESAEPALQLSFEVIQSRRRRFRVPKQHPVKKVKLTLLSESGKEVLLEKKLRSGDGKYVLQPEDLEGLPETVLVQVEVPEGRILSQLADLRVDYQLYMRYVVYKKGHGPTRLLGVPRF